MRIPSEDKVYAASNEPGFAGLSGVPNVDGYADYGSLTEAQNRAPDRASAVCSTWPALYTARVMWKQPRRAARAGC